MKLPWGALRPISVGDDLTSFRSGTHSLDRFLHKYALFNEQLGLSRTFVLPRPADDDAMPALIGFHAVAMGSVESAPLAKALKAALPRYPAPVALIAQLASHETLRGLGIGVHLLMDALARLKGMSQQIGFAAVVTDAIDPKAESFYVKYGFMPLDPSGSKYPRRLILATASIP